MLKIQETSAENQLTSTVCKNCDHHFEGNFCNHCGQEAKTQRINFQYQVEAVSNSLFQIERGFLFTLKELFLAPGKTIFDFLKGKRQPYVKPLAYLMFTSTLYVLATHLLELNTYSKDFTEGFGNAMNDDINKDTSGIIQVLNWIASNHAVTVLLTIPLFSLGSYLVFKKSRYNYSEHLVLNTYIAAQQMVIYLVLSFFVTKDSFTEVLPFAFGMVFNFFALYQFFSSRNAILRVLSILLTYGIFILQLGIILFMSVGLIEVVIK